MNFKFIVNDYVLIWNLLFQPSTNEASYKLKQKLWNTYKKEYNEAYKDKKEILKDAKNFIPKDDTIYNIILENKGYEIMLNHAEKYRNNIMKLWDDNKKSINKEFKNIIRKDISEYKIYVADDNLDLIDISKENKSIMLGKKDLDKDLIYKLLLTILSSEIEIEEKDQYGIKQSIIELAILNELETRIEKKSKYLSGTPELSNIKRMLYPYWLMYLGIEKDDLLHYMMRDKIAFEIDNYQYSTKLSKLNLEEFISFIVRNIKHISKQEEAI
jgi:hypothetical protein